MTILDHTTWQQHTQWTKCSEPNNPQVVARICSAVLLDDEGNPVVKDGKEYRQFIVEHKILGQQHNRDVATSRINPDDKIAYRALRARFRDTFEAMEGKLETKPGQRLADFKELPHSVRENLMRSGIETIEDLADLDDESIRTFGPTSKEWRNKAKKFLREQAKPVEAA